MVEPRRRKSDREIPADPAFPELTMLLDRRRSAARAHRARLAAYGLLVAALAFIFWRQSEAFDGLEQESLQRAYVLCVQSNEARSGIMLFLEDLARGDDGQIGPDEERGLAFAADRFAQRPCPPEPVEP